MTACMYLKLIMYYVVDVLLILDHERLYIDFQRDLPKGTAIVRLPKSGGVSSFVVRDKEFFRLL